MTMSRMRVAWTAMLVNVHPSPQAGDRHVINMRWEFHFFCMHSIFLLILQKIAPVPLSLLVSGRTRVS